MGESLNVFRIKGALAFEELEIELSKVNLFIGSDDSGVFEVGRSIVALNLASQIKDPYLAFLRLFGTKPYSIMDNNSSILLNDISLELDDQKMSFIVGKPIWLRTAFLPSERVGILKTLLNLLRVRSPSSLIAMESLIEYTWAPVRFFLNSIVPPYHIAETQEECFELLLNKLEKLSNLIEDPRTIRNSPIDEKLLSKVVNDLEKDDLLYIEDPGVFKPVKKAKEYVQSLIRKVIDKGAHIILVSYRSAPLYAISGLVEKEELSAAEVRAYHFTTKRGRREAKSLPVEEGIGILPEDLEFMVEVTP
ncbi:hypothetical protein IPA_01370 [Ignicoccus pacificus DSM 13166]|uniref:Uncharacterized protein n=1 Tax=Ignicoccus pacificus DSM 13166 TaxID=940294 RepID=A0A977KAH1_9CREN|nr:hypothetical protein IPA_01370 [Ignicoccus pacificus DSM 13166]